MKRQILNPGFVATALSTLFYGCAGVETSDIPQDMKIATPDMVTQCRLIGDVHGVSGLYGVFAESGLTKARQQAFDQARSMHADTIIWGPFATPYGSTSVSGLAYACKSQP